MRGLRVKPFSEKVLLTSFLLFLKETFFYLSFYIENKSIIHNAEIHRLTTRKLHTVSTLDPIEPVFLNRFSLETHDRSDHYDLVARNV